MDASDSLTPDKKNGKLEEVPNTHSPQLTDVTTENEQAAEDGSGGAEGGLGEAEKADPPLATSKPDTQSTDSVSATETNLTTDSQPKTASPPSSTKTATQLQAHEDTTETSSNVEDQDSNHSIEIDVDREVTRPAQSPSQGSGINATSAETQPTDPLPSDGQLIDSQQCTNQPTDLQKPGNQSADPQQSEDPPADPQQLKNQPADPQKSETQPTDTQPSGHSETTEVPGASHKDSETEIQRKTQTEEVKNLSDNRERISSEDGSGGEVKDSDNVYSTVVSPQQLHKTLSPMNSLSWEEEVTLLKEAEEVKKNATEKKKGLKSALLKSAGISLQQGSESSPQQDTKTQQQNSNGGVRTEVGSVSSEQPSSPDDAHLPSPTTRYDSPNLDDRNLEEFSEILLDSDFSPSDSELPVEHQQQGSKQRAGKRVRFADEVEAQGKEGATAAGIQRTKSPPPLTGLIKGGEEATKHPGVPVSPSSPGKQEQTPTSPSHTLEELVSGVEYSAEYLGSTPVFLAGSGGAKMARTFQAQQAVKLIKDPDNESSPRFSVKLKISTKSIKIADSQSDVDLMDHPLHTITYVADINNVLVIMAHKVPIPPAPSSSSSPSSSSPSPSSSSSTPTSPSSTPTSPSSSSTPTSPSSSSTPTSPSSSSTPTDSSVKGEGHIPRLTCHILEAPDARCVALAIGQAFSAAYKEFLKANGITEEDLEEAEYTHILNAQSRPRVEVESFTDRDKTRKLTLAKHKGEMMGIMVMESGYGSAIPACVIAHMSKTGAAARSGLLNVGDHIISMNGVSLVGMPQKACIEQIKRCRIRNVVKMVVCSCPAVVDLNIVRPDLKYQLGFTVQDGVICSLQRGSIAEHSGIRVGHRIIEINGTSTVGLGHDDTVYLLSTTVGDLHIRTMPLLMYKLLTGQATPEYH